MVPTLFIALLAAVRVAERAPDDVANPTWSAHPGSYPTPKQPSARRRLPLPAAYHRVQGLMLSHGRRRLEGALDATETLHVAFDTPNKHYDVELFHVNLWARDAVFIVNEHEPCP